MRLVAPGVSIPLDPEFRPPVLANRLFREEVKAAGEGVPLVIGIERSSGMLSRYETEVFPPEHPQAEENLDYVAQLVKFLLWQRGGWRVIIGGPAQVGEYVKKVFSPGEEHGFDGGFMAGVYEQDFTVEIKEAGEVPPAPEKGIPLGRHLEGCRIGFDAGASDYKVAAVIDGEAVYNDEFPWDPKVQQDPEYHYQHFMQGLKAAAEHLPRVDAIGVSTAGVVIDNRVAIASLFRGIPDEVFEAKVRDMWLHIKEEWGGLPLEVANDGDVAALAGAMSMGATRLLGVAFGSSIAAGYVNEHGNITGWLNELAFVPVDLSPSAPVSDWSQCPGTGDQYLCQTGAVRLAEHAGIKLDSSQHLAEQLKELQALIAQGEERARQVYETLGVWAGYTIAHYADFYDLEHVLLMGRVTSGPGGAILLHKAREVLAQEFPELAARLDLRLPGEAERRVGQAIAAASLPALE